MSKETREILTAVSNYYDRETEDPTPPIGIDAAEELLDELIAEKVAEADRTAMLREATHRANDAVDRLLRLDRNYVVEYLQVYLANLGVSVFTPPAEQSKEDV